MTAAHVAEDRIASGINGILGSIDFPTTTAGNTIPSMSVISLLWFVVDRYMIGKKPSRHSTRIRSVVNRPDMGTLP